MKVDKNVRDAAILDVVYNGGYPITQIVSKEYLDGTDTFAESTKQFINKYGHVAITLKGDRDLTLRTLQEIMAGTTPPEGTELFCVVTENDNYRKPENMTLDEHFELLLKEPNQFKFLQSCGYTEVKRTAQEFKRKQSGFNDKEPGFVYVVRYYNENIEFIKYGITHNYTDKRHEEQAGAAKRVGIHYDWEVLFKSPMSKGKQVVETETILKKLTKQAIYKQHHNITKAIFPDGYSETVPIDYIIDVLDCVENTKWSLD